MFLTLLPDLSEYETLFSKLGFFKTFAPEGLKDKDKFQCIIRSNCVEFVFVSDDIEVRFVLSLKTTAVTVIVEDISELFKDLSDVESIDRWINDSLEYLKQPPEVNFRSSRIRGGLGTRNL